MSIITVRPMRAGDGPFLLACVKSLADSHGSLWRVTATAEALECQILGNPKQSGCEIAELDGAPAGYGLWHRSFSSFTAQPIMYLEDISVLPPFQRKGVARALLRRIGEICLARGFAEAYWHVMDWNDGASALYKQAGAEISDKTRFVWWSKPEMAEFLEVTHG